MSNYTPNRAGFEQIALSAPVRDAVLRVAEKAKEIAVGLSAEFTDTGDYISHFEVDTTETTVHGRYPHRAVAGVLANTSGHAAAVEWGYEGRAGRPSRSAHHILARTLDALEHG